MRDLLAIATVRRLRLELGLPVETKGAGGVVDQVELWIGQPCAELGGLSPLQALDAEDGEVNIRAYLLAMADSEKEGPCQS
jgi:hypothetical protein